MGSINKRSIGSHYEDIACDFLKDQGFTILSRNFRCRTGEIDIIALDSDCLCFIEVKYRKNDSYGRPSSAVTISKQRTIIKVSEYYIMKRNMYDFMRRYDVVEILDNDITLIKNAFGG